MDGLMLALLLQVENDVLLDRIRRKREEENEIQDCKG